MTLDFALFKYFPYGGLQRDFLKTAIECQKLGHTINVYTSDWEGSHPEGFNIQKLSVTGSTNYQQMRSFQSELLKTRNIAGKTHNLLIGFNKVAGLDIYFASDTCYREKAHSERGRLYRLMPRYKEYEQLERAVFSTEAKTNILILTTQQQKDFQKHYQTPAARFTLLPPGISRNPFISDRENIKSHYRKEFQLSERQHILLMVGSSFRTKGLDRAITALASLPGDLRKNTKLLVVGGDKPDRFIKQASKLKVSQQVIFIGSRDDVSKIMLCADILVHPAYTESAGMVLVEAIAAGLPVLTTGNCGYSFHVEAAQAGIVMPSPFSQAELNQKMQAMVGSEYINNWRKNACKYAETTDLYSLHKRAAEYIDSQTQ